MTCIPFPCNKDATTKTHRWQEDKLGELSPQHRQDISTGEMLRFGFLTTHYIHLGGVNNISHSILPYRGIKPSNIPNKILEGSIGTNGNLVNCKGSSEL
jgi:hypothetical protein